MIAADSVSIEMGGRKAPPIFEARDLSVRFATPGRKGAEDTVLALDGIDWTVEKGEFVSFVGPSGCGKTTMLKLISGIVAPTSGQILHWGRPVSGTPEGIGMAFQDSLLLPWRNVLDNVLLPIEILRRPRKDYLGRAEELLATVGLKGFEKRDIWELSGGMRQRVSLCRALIANPEILLLDEPFAALDAFTREDLWLVLQELHARSGCTMVLITHQLGEAVFLSDRVLVVSKRPGQIIHVEAIKVQRPRSPDDLVDPDFLAQVASLRRKIER
jgi:NitT/TauT family transport system ATP-binding protein